LLDPVAPNPLAGTGMGLELLGLVHLRPSGQDRLGLGLSVTPRLGGRPKRLVQQPLQLGHELAIVARVGHHLTTIKRFCLTAAVLGQHGLYPLLAGEQLGLPGLGQGELLLGLLVSALRFEEQ
jgi:hypothetical protein